MTTRTSNELPTNETVLVTGGAGYIGSHAVLALQTNGCNVIVLDNLVYGHRDLIENTLGVELIEGDIGDYALLCELFQARKISAVIHFAAYAYVGESHDNPGKYYRNNVVCTLSLLEAMRDSGVKKLCSLQPVQPTESLMKFRSQNLKFKGRLILTEPLSSL